MNLVERCSTVGLSNNDESTKRLSTTVKIRVRKMTDYENIAILRKSADTACSGARERSRDYGVVAGIAKTLLRIKVTLHAAEKRGITWRFRASFDYFSPTVSIYPRYASR